MIDRTAAEQFLTMRLAVVGASPETGNFGGTIYRELRHHGRDVVAVNRRPAEIDGDACYPDLGSIPTPVDGVVVMVGRDAAVDVLQSCVDHGIGNVWLFKGLGGPGAVSEEALDYCRAHGLNVIAGACPLMFLEPVGWFHRAHRAARRLNHSVVDHRQEVSA